MSTEFLQLALTCVLMALIQGLAAVPWLLAVDLRNRVRVRRVANWALGLLLVVGVGLAFAFYLDLNYERVLLNRWGRFYMSLLHLQLAADLFVGVFFGLLTFWSKGGAVALAAFQEGVRQPMFWLLYIVAVLLMVVSPVIPFFTFGEDLKMVKDLCYAVTMLAPAAFAVIAASISVSEEIEGRTAVTVMSKPISRRQFLLGKFSGTLLAALAMTLLLGWVLVWVVLFKPVYDKPIPGSQDVPDPAWVVGLMTEWFSEGGVRDLLSGVFFWVNDAGVALPGLVIGFCQVMVLLAIAVALATRLAMAVNLTLCLLVYFLGHLTPIMTEVTRVGNPLVRFVAQLFDTVLPGLDLFDVGSAVIRDLPLPPVEYAMYTVNVTLYALTYTAIALLFGLILFEDRDLA